MTTLIRNARKVHQKSDTHTVAENARGWFDVTSGASGNTYQVFIHQTGQIENASCTCGWGTKGGNLIKWQSACSHVQAVFEYRENKAAGRTTSAWNSQNDAAKQHRPVKDIGDGVILTTRKTENKPAAPKFTGTREQAIEDLGF